MLLGRALIGGSSCHGEIVDDRFHVLAGDVFGDHGRTGEVLPLAEVALGVPMVGVRLVNVMGGFVAPGTTRSPERQPMWLPKAVGVPVAHGAEIPIPAVLTGPVQMEA